MAGAIERKMMMKSPSRVINIQTDQENIKIIKKEEPEIETIENYNNPNKIIKPKQKNKNPLTKPISDPLDVLPATMPPASIIKTSPKKIQEEETEGEEGIFEEASAPQDVAEKIEQVGVINTAKALSKELMTKDTA